MMNFLQIFLHIKCLSIIGINAHPFVTARVSEVGPNEYPFMVSLAYAPANEVEHHFCGATLISKSHILTSKQCLEYEELENIRATVGLHDMTQEPKYGIESYETYVDWAVRTHTTIDCELWHDIVVAKLKSNVKNPTPVTLSKLTPTKLAYHGFFRPIMMDESKPDQGTMGVGWGATVDEGEPGHLHKVPLFVLGNYITKSNYESVKMPTKFAENHLATSSLRNAPPVLFGKGDKGGPLLHNRELIGVHNHATATDMKHRNLHLGHISVHYYRKFIESYMEKPEMKPSPDSEHDRPDRYSAESRASSSKPSNSGSEAFCFGTGLRRRKKSLKN